MPAQMVPSLSSSSSGSASAVTVTAAAAVPCGWTNPLDASRYQGFQFSTRMYEEQGWNLCQALLAYADPAKRAWARAELEAMYPLPLPRSPYRR